MRIYFLLPAMIIIAFWFIVRSFYIMYQKKKFVLRQEVMNLLFLASVLFIIKMTIFPLEIGVPYKYGANHNFIPFTSIQSMLNHSYFMVPLRNIAGNIILFMPLGFVLALKYSRLKSAHKVGMVSLLSSTFIEITQLLLPIRAFDIDDIILNTIGAILGYLVLITFEKVFYKTSKNDQDVTYQHGSNDR